MNREKIEPVAFNSWFARMFGGVETPAANTRTRAPGANRPKLAPRVDLRRDPNWMAPDRLDRDQRARARGAV